MSCPDGCFRVYYHIYLVKAGSQNTFNVEELIYFTNLSISGTLSITPDNLAVVGARLAEVNVPASIACSPEYPGLNDPGTSNSPILNYDPNTNVFTYEMSATNYSLPIVNLSVYGRLLLFVLAVDVFPDETVVLSSLSCDAVLTESNGSNPEICNLLIQEGCDDMSPSLTKTIPQPVAACNNISNGPPYLRIGSAVNDPIPGFPNRKKVPVWVSGSASTHFEFSEIDFLVSVSPDPAVMQAPRIEKGLIDSSSIRIYPAGAEYRLYVHAADAFDISNNGSGPDEDNILFYIVLDGPQLESACLDITVDFPGEYGRIDGGMFDCCAPNFGSEELVQWDAIDCAKELCDEVTLIAKNSGGQQFNCDNIAVFELLAAATANTGISELRCVLDIQKTGDYSLVTTGGGASSSPYCSPVSGCVTLTDVAADMLRFEFVLTGLSPLTVGPSYNSGNPRLLATIALESEDGGCIEGITFRDVVILKYGQDETCLTSWESEFDPADVADDVCGGSLNMSAETDSGKIIQGWEYYVNRFPAGNDDFTDCYQEGNSLGAATATVCACVLNDTEQNVALRKTDNPLNGVTTYDLVLISKHILALEPLTTGFRILAADVDMSASVTTTDIVLIRRLILGLDDEFEFANSWRFIDKDLQAIVHASSNPFPLIHTFPSIPDPSNNNGGAIYSTIDDPNRFADEEFEEFSIPATMSLDSKTSFIGFKVGDVNDTAIPNSLLATDDRSAGECPLGTRTIKDKAGKFVEIPVFSLDNQELSGWQLALGYDPAQLEISGIRWPSEVPAGAAQNRDWHISHTGELRILWFDAARVNSFEPGTPLFFVQARLLRDQPKASRLFELRALGLSAEAYSAGGEPLKLTLEVSDIPVLRVVPQAPEAAPMHFNLSAYPNPAGGHFRFNVEASESATARFTVRNTLGISFYEGSMELQAGINTMPATQLPVLPAGQYFISLRTPASVETLRFIRQ